MAVLSDELLKQQLAEQYRLALDEVVTAVASGSCNLFLGSGVHAAPPAKHPVYSAPPESLPPIGNGLAAILAKVSQYEQRFGKEDSSNLQRVSQFFEAQLGRRRLEEEIEKAVETGKEPSAILKGLANLSFPVVVTTNYDTLFQKALAQAGKFPTVSVYEANDDGRPREVVDSNRPVHPQQPFLFKMHGDIQGFRSIVITEEDYIQFVLRFRDDRPIQSIPQKVLESITSSPTVFIGYSLRDYNLRVWLKMLRKIVGSPNKFPVNYSIDFRPDAIIFDVWYSQRRYVNFIAQNVWEFVPELYRRVTGHEMPV
jgi:SIR2-like domain